MTFTNVVNVWLFRLKHMVSRLYGWWNKHVHGYQVVAVSDTGSYIYRELFFGRIAYYRVPSTNIVHRSCEYHVRISAEGIENELSCESLPWHPVSNAPLLAPSLADLRLAAEESWRATTYQPVVF